MSRLHWFATDSGRIELCMTVAQARSASHSGSCDSDVAALSQVPRIKAQLALVDPVLLAAELREYGAWDSQELADHAQNLQRILWLAAGDIADGLE